MVPSTRRAAKDRPCGPTATSAGQPEYRQPSLLPLVKPMKPPTVPPAAKDLTSPTLSCEGVQTLAPSATGVNEVRLAEAGATKARAMDAPTTTTVGMATGPDLTTMERR